MVKRRRKERSKELQLDSKRLATTPEKEPQEKDEFPSPFLPSKSRSTSFKMGDLVLAKYRQFPYWPAVFYKYMLKKNGVKKARVHFLENLTESENKSLMTIRVESLKFYITRNKQDILLNKHSEDLGKSYDRADDYLRKRALGKVVDFFADLVSSSEDECEEEMGEEKCLATHIPHDHTSDETSDSENEEELTKIETKSKVDINTEYHSSITSWVKDNSRDILRKISMGEISSDRHRTFFYGTQKERDKLKWNGGYGSLQTQQGEPDELAKILIEWCKEDCSSFQPFNRISYIFNVWLPEAIIRAISFINDKSFKEAEEEYLT